MYGLSQRKRSFLLLEMISAVVLTAMALGLFALALTQFVTFNGILLARQSAVMAAEAALNEIRAGEDVTPESLAGRFPQMHFEIERSAGQGEWEGLERVSLEVRSVPKYGREISVRVSGCMGRDKQ